jgi:hypothetical protein
MNLSGQTIIGSCHVSIDNTKLKPKTEEPCLTRMTNGNGGDANVELRGVPLQRTQE